MQDWPKKGTIVFWFPQAEPEEKNQSFYLPQDLDRAQRLYYELCEASDEDPNLRWEYTVLETIPIPDRYADGQCDCHRWYASETSTLMADCERTPYCGHDLEGTLEDQ